jgi:hypothetical protein
MLLSAAEGMWTGLVALERICHEPIRLLALIRVAFVEYPALDEESSNDRFRISA